MVKIIILLFTCIVTAIQSKSTCSAKICAVCDRLNKKKLPDSHAFRQVLNLQNYCHYLIDESNCCQRFYGSGGSIGPVKKKEANLNKKIQSLRIVEFVFVIAVSITALYYFVTFIKICTKNVTNASLISMTLE
jgi:hypothetical protein